MTISLFLESIYSIHAQSVLKANYHNAHKQFNQCSGTHLPIDTERDSTCVYAAPKDYPVDVA